MPRPPPSQSKKGKALRRNKKYNAPRANIVPKGATWFSNVGGVDASHELLLYGVGNHGLEQITNNTPGGRMGLSYRNTIYDFESHRTGAEDGDGWELACADRRRQVRLAT